MDNCWISYQVIADMEKFYDDLMIINLYESALASKKVIWENC